MSLRFSILWSDRSISFALKNVNVSSVAYVSIVQQVSYVDITRKGEDTNERGVAIIFLSSSVDNTIHHPYTYAYRVCL
ncbi:MAG TPA: hypothetical protein DHW02_23325 [Ktedonobacter sp.]|nr:hypothetical protein [Ktedonobacter sp.]